MIKKIINLSSLLYVVIIIILLGNFYYINENNKLRSQMLTIGNAFKNEKENNKKSFLRDLELTDSSRRILISQNDLFQANVCDSYMLVYFYSGSECEKCIFDDIDKIRDFISFVFTENVCVFPVFDGSREIEISLKADLRGLNYRRLNREGVVLPSVDGKNARFFAILTPEGKLINYFFPDVLLPHKTNLYLEFIKEKYFN